jgi:hypothetical protein
MDHVETGRWVMGERVGTGLVRLRNRQIYKAILDQVDRAERQILLISPYIVPNEPLVTGLLRALHRGVRLKVRFEAEKAESYRHASWLTRLAAAGAEFGAAAGFHFKTYVFDHTCIDTSMNLTRSSFKKMENGSLFRLERGPECRPIIDQLEWIRRRARPVEPAQPALALESSLLTDDSGPRCAICSGPLAICIARQRGEELSLLLKASIAVGRASEARSSRASADGLRRMRAGL